MVKIGQFVTIWSNLEPNGLIWTQLNLLRAFFFVLIGCVFFLSREVHDFSPKKVAFTWRSNIWAALAALGIQIWRRADRLGTAPGGMATREHYLPTQADYLRAHTGQ